MEVLATYDSLLETSSETNFSAAGIGDDEIRRLMDNNYLYTKIVEDFKREALRHHEPTTVILLTLYIPVFLMAFVGNIMVLFVVLPHRHMRNVTNFFLVNLAVADLTGRNFDTS